MKITKRQLRRIIREAIDVINSTTGEIIEFGDGPGVAAPEAAWPDLKRRLGLQPEFEDSRDVELSEAEWELLRDETEGKRQVRRYRAEKQRLNPSRLLDRARTWAADAGADWAADNPDVDLAGVARDLAKGAEFAFKPDEWRTMKYEFRGGEADLLDFIADAMVQ